MVFWQIIFAFEMKGYRNEIFHKNSYKCANNNLFNNYPEKLITIDKFRFSINTNRQINEKATENPTNAS